MDTARYHPRRRSPELRFQLTGGAPDEPLVLYAGRLSPEKNVGDLEVVLDRVPEARLALVGDGPARRDLEARFAGRHAVFTGFLRGEKLAAAFASADVFVMPSTTETLGFVVLEAMSSGTPVVAANAGGVRDLISHGENGLLYDPGRPAELADAVQRLLSHRSMRRFYAGQARKAAEACDWSRETAKLVEDYRRAIVIRRQERGVLSRLRLAALG